MKFRKKPVVIDAFQMTEARRMDNSDWPNWLNSAWNEERDQEGSLQRADMTAVLPDMLEIVTLEGNHKVSWGDYIIRGVQGEIYPCKPEIFVATYEPVGDIDPAEVLEAASMWKGPGETPHRYSPDYMAQGDCQICGHSRGAHQSSPDAVARLVEAAKWVRDQSCEGFCRDLPRDDYYDKEMDIDCAGCRVRAALAAMEASHDRT